MNISDKLPRGVRRLLRLPPTRASRLRDLDEEIRFHMETHVARLRAQGMPENEALAAAVARFGDADDLRAYAGGLAARREPLRRARQWIDELGQDLHGALRQIRRAPGFTAAAVLILSLGIGATTGVFSIVHHLLIAPLPFADGNRMVTFMSMGGGGKISITPTAALLESWRDRARSVEQVILFRDTRFTLGDSTRGSTEQLSGAAVPPAMFNFLGLAPLRGRPIVASDTMADAPPVALLGEGVWQRRFGGADNVIGTSVLLNGTLHTVIGVVPDRFVVPFSDDRDVFVAMRRGVSGRLTGIAKLRPGVSVDEANRELAALFSPRSVLNPEGDPPQVARAVDLVGRSRKQMVLMLFGAVGMVLLIGCANVANLLLARSWTRQREFAVRAALGAGRRRIGRQVLTESLLLAVFAGALGIAMAFVVLGGIRAVIPNGATDYKGVGIDGAVLLWSVVISALTGILFGVIPAVAAAGTNAGESLKAGGRTAAGSRAARRVRTGLVVGELALSVMLLVGTGLLVRTLVALSHMDVGMQTQGLMGGSLRWPATSLTDPEARHATFGAAADAVRAIPGVRDAIVSGFGPLDYGISMGGIQVEGQPTAPSDSLRTLSMAIVPPEFFRFTGISIRRGHTFSTSSGAGQMAGTGEFIINETLARRLWPDGNALGARIRQGTAGPYGTIVGIVGDVRLPGNEAANRRLNEDLQLYRPYSAAAPFAALLVRSDLPVGALTASITKALHDVSPELELSNVTTADAVIAQSTAGQRFMLELLGAFAFVAVLLAALGLHAVVSYDVNQRTREIGVRIALGAEPSDVTRLVLTRGVGVAMVGVVLGATAAIGATRVLRTFLYGVTPGDPVTLLAVGAVLLAVAVGSSYAPARRAARLDPVETLRAD